MGEGVEVKRSNNQLKFFSTNIHRCRTLKFETR